MSDPNFYRFYESNLEAYKIKADKEFRCAKCELGEATATSLTTTSLTLGGVSHYSGTSALSTTHTISVPAMSNRNCQGELTCYLKNDTYAAVVMTILVKAAGVVNYTLLYQNVGNFTSVGVSSSGNNVVLTCSPIATLTWVFRGI